MLGLFVQFRGQVAIGLRQVTQKFVSRLALALASFDITQTFEAFQAFAFQSFQASQTFQIFQAPQTSQTSELLLFAFPVAGFALAKTLLLALALLDFAKEIPGRALLFVLIVLTVLTILTVLAELIFLIILIVLIFVSALPLAVLLAPLAHTAEVVLVVFLNAFVVHVFVLLIVDVVVVLVTPLITVLIIQLVTEYQSVEASSAGAGPACRCDTNESEQ